MTNSFVVVGVVLFSLCGLIVGGSFLVESNRPNSNSLDKTTVASSSTTTTMVPTEDEEDEDATTTTVAPPSFPGYKISVYTANHHLGRSAHLWFDSKQCQNLPRELRNRVQSVDTYGRCVILCDHLDCDQRGLCLRFEPGTPAHNRFRKLRFHNLAESAMPCD